MCAANFPHCNADFVERTWMEYIWSKVQFFRAAYFVCKFPKLVNGVFLGNEIWAFRFWEVLHINSLWKEFTPGPLWILQITSREAQYTIWLVGPLMEAPIPISYNNIWNKQTYFSTLYCLLTHSFSKKIFSSHLIKCFITLPAGLGYFLW